MLKTKIKTAHVTADFQPAVRRDARIKNRVDVGFNILTALKGWVGLAPQGRGALHIIYWHCALHIIIFIIII